jgi:hypothetical protein
VKEGYLDGSSKSTNDADNVVCGKSRMPKTVASFFVTDDKEIPNKAQGCGVRRLLGVCGRQHSGEFLQSKFCW